MSDPQTENDQPTDTVAELQRKIRLAIAPAGVSGPGVSICDRLVKVAILVTEKATEKALSRAIGFDLDLVGDVLAGLDQAGSVAGRAGVWQISRSEAELAADQAAASIRAEWLRIEALAECSTCTAVVGDPCRSKIGKETTPHTARRKAAMNSGPSQEGIAA